MEHFIHEADHMVVYLAEIGALLLETVGIITLLLAAFKGVVGCIKKDPRARLNLGEGIATALSFLLCGEVLHTVVAGTWEAVGILAATFLTRAAISILLHWENGHERHHIQEHGQH